MKKTDTTKNDKTSPPPKNTRNREYYGTDPNDDPDEEVETFSMSDTSSTSAPQTPSKDDKRVTTSDNPEDDLVTVSKESTPSPTASDLVLKSDIKDCPAAAEFNREMREQGVSAQERRRRLLEFQGKMDAEREIREQGERDELNREYGDGEGKGKGVFK